MEIIRHDDASLVVPGSERPSVSPIPFDILLDATRELLWIKTSADAKRIASDLVVALGGVIVPARGADTDALPVDMSFGEGEPIVPSAPSSSVARMLLERHLPSFVQDVRRAVELASQAERLAEDAAIDTVTKLPNRRMLGRAMGRQRAGLAIMLDLDHFKTVNDTLGHAEGDRVLRAFGRTLRTNVREQDIVGRYGGEEFVVILADGTDADAFLERLRGAWEEDRPHAITFSAGIARVGADPSSTLKAADRAMYRAKAAGRNQWAWADDGHDTEVVPIAAETNGRLSRPSFVTFSELEVPDGGPEQLETAFQERLRAVDRRPGFRSLEAWSDLGDPTKYAMVTWWESAEALRAYTRSDDDQRSPDRTPAGEHQLPLSRFRRFSIVAR